jgi:negative regulator of flagellin synthesis FlgM
MKVTNLYQPPHAGDLVKDSQNAQPVKDKIHETDSNAKKKDSLPATVDLSEKGQLVQKIASHLREVPDIRKDEVEAIKSKIQDKSYSVDPKQIADKMLAEFLKK